MYIVINIDDIKDNELLFGDKITNTIIDNSFFYNIHYSNKYLSLQNIITQHTIRECMIQKYYNKYKFDFNEYKNKETIYKIIKFENKILLLFQQFNNIINKKPNYKLSEHLSKGIIKCNIKKELSNTLSNITFYLKISGIWENQNEYGLIYKFYYM